MEYKYKTVITSDQGYSYRWRRRVLRETVNAIAYVVGVREDVDHNKYPYQKANTVCDAWNVPLLRYINKDSFEVLENTHNLHVFRVDLSKKGRITFYHNMDEYGDLGYPEKYKGREGLDDIRIFDKRDDRYHEFVLMLRKPYENVAYIED